MNKAVPVLIGLGVLAAGGVALAMNRDEDGRTIHLIRGKRYAVVHRIVGPGWDASMYPGFCNFSEPVITGQGGRGNIFTEVQFTAEWCASNTEFLAPENMAITELD